jgi:hypothetical protein
MSDDDARVSQRSTWRTTLTFRSSGMVEQVIVDRK